MFMLDCHPKKQDGSGETGCQLCQSRATHNSAITKAYISAESLRYVNKTPYNFASRGKDPSRKGRGIEGALTLGIWDSYQFQFHMI